MVTKWYETECPLLSPAARERLRESRARRDSRLRTQIESAEAVAVAADGVREFADGLLFSQGRLGPHASTLREYTASLVNEIRSASSVAQGLPSNPSLPWAQDPIALKAMEACEEAIAERDKVGDRWPYGCPPTDAKNIIWAPIVQAWEGHKAANKIEFALRECIPESVLRGLLASQHRIKPENVEREQMRRAGADLCCHYGPMVMLPLDAETRRPTESAPEPKRDTRFWKEREDEFRKHDTPGNSRLSAEWFSLDGHWSIHGAPGKAASTSRAKQVFKSLARVAASGFGGARRVEPWLAWLEALRCATDRSTGERLYSKVSLQGSHVLGESELERMASSGELIAAGGLVEFVVARQPEGDADGSTGHSLPSDVHAEMRRVWETTTETIEGLFVTSANFCLELRSRVSNPGLVTAAENSFGGDGPVPIHEVAAENPAARPKRGPRPDYETASRVAKIVADQAPGGNWRTRLDDICMALDDAQINCPKTWSVRYGHGNWYAPIATGNAKAREIVIKAIKHQLDLAKEDPAETLS